MMLRAAAFAAGIAAAGPAVAFVPGGDAGSSGVTAEEAFARAARWSVTSEALAAGGERGLGGGLEFSVDASVCVEFEFIDAAGCDAIVAVIEEAGRRWAAGHPRVRFVNVTRKITPVLAPRDEPWTGHGAEIDFFAVPERDFAAAHGAGKRVAADTTPFYVAASKPRAADGSHHAAAVGAITAVDVRFNAGQCFYMDAANARAGCMHFPSVVLHEFAHVIGLDHPDEHPERNLDLDADPGNRLEVGCGAPLAELRASRRTERFAVANARWSGDDPWRRGLTYDDFAGRDALYPDCGITAAPAVAGGPRLWGAFARGEGSAYGWARGYDDANDARRRAVAECGRHGRGCRVVTDFDACFAYARSSEAGAWGWAARSDPDSAAAASVAHCRAYGPGCEAALAVCAVDGG